MAKKNKPDYYKILNLTVKANDKDIKNAALKMLEKYRPDVYKKGDSALRSEEVLEARDTLLDPEKRSKYDRYWLETYNTHQSQTIDERVFKATSLQTNTGVKVNDNLSVRKESSNKFLNFFNKLQLPERKENKEYPFLFHIYNWKTDGMIFLVTGILIPLIALFLLALLAHMGQNYDGSPWGKNTNYPISMNGEDASPMVFFAINIVSNIVGFIIFYTRDSKVFIKSGLVIFYNGIFIVQFISLICELILVSAGMKTNSFAFTIISVWVQVLAEILVIYLAFRQTKGLKERIITTIKNFKMKDLLTVLGGAVLMMLIMSFIMSNIFKGVPAINGQSANEGTLEHWFTHGTTGQKVGWAITLFVFSILIAPLEEELSCRHAIYAGTSNRTIAFFAAALYFGFLHVQTGDVEHILNYFIGGLVLSGIFSISRGNVTLDTGAHMTYNLMTLLVIFATDLPK